MIIDATNLIAGRLATYVAKNAILGEGIVIINAEKAVITGKKKMLHEKVKQKYDRGIPTKGPFTPKQPDRYLKRLIRGMIPYKLPKGKTAFQKIKCFIGVPENYKDQKAVTVENANVKKLPNYNYLTINDLCKHLGGKI